MACSLRPDAGAPKLLAAMLERAIARRVPLSGSIAMTHRCHLRCVHCYLGDERSARPPQGELGTEFWLSVIDQVADAGCLNLLMTGGETLLRPDFPAVYERARRRGMLVTVFTNGTLIGERLVRLFQEFSPDLVEITLYGGSPETYERVTEIPGSFERCLRGLDALLAGRIRTALKAMVLAENRHEVEAMRRIASERGLAFRLDAALFPAWDGDHSPLDHRIPPEEAVAIEMRDTTFHDRASEYFNKMRGQQPPDQQLYSCMAGLTGFHVDPRGMLLPCLMVSTHGYDLRHGSFRTGWDEVLRGFTEQKVVPGYECHRCETRFLCGLCPAQAAMESGSPYGRSEYLCRLGDLRRRAVTGNP
jgi:radical SAM protein with 4Fe4S-binding SPASM domain